LDESSDDEPSKPKRPEWQDPVRWCAWANVAVLLVIIIFLAVALGVSANGVSFDSLVLSRGSKEAIDRAKTGLHLLVNVLSVTLTATSSYCCHIVLAPSRKAVDEAHSQRVWLTIATFGLQNFSKVSWKRKFFWLLLTATSLAIQLRCVSQSASAVSH
jgi:hypothetical protein